MANKKLIVGNWKMNPSTLAEAKDIFLKINNTAQKLDNVDVVLCPPFVFTSSFSGHQKKTALGAQSVFQEETGSYTGQVSVNMLVDCGVTHVIVGHSEERALGDTDEIVSKKMKLVMDADMTPIVCVGEKVRDENGQYLDTLKEQIKNTLANIPKKYSRDIVVAYEPIWAIGASAAMKPEDVYEMSLFVKKVFSDVFGVESALKLRVLYGGSVNSANALEIMSIGKVDGLLVGRESLNPAGFGELLKQVDTIK